MIYDLLSPEAEELNGRLLLPARCLKLLPLLLKSGRWCGLAAGGCGLASGESGKG